jgi:processing peptidase subunit alpha
MSYTYDAFKAYVPEMVEVLIDSVRNPVFFDWEIKEQVCCQLKLALQVYLSLY